MPKATIYTRNGDTIEMDVTEEDGRWVDELPFESENVTRTVVTDDGH